MTKDLHGGNIYKFQREGKNDILDYSSNINPLGVPQKFIDIAKESFDKLVNYPDPYYIDLRKKTALIFKLVQFFKYTQQFPFFQNFSLYQ